jgi:hypothetical protein
MWLCAGPRRLLASYGGVFGAVAAASLLAITWSARAIDQGEPALAAGLQPGESVTWTGLASPAQALAGDWLRDPRGTCRENLDHPRPGSEQAGLLDIAPGSVYGQDGQTFSITAPLFEERPPVIDGTQMDGGIAFGIRDKDDYYVLEQSALHDVVRLDHFVHGRRRDVREATVRTHGDEWHTLQVRVAGDRVEAGIDGQPAFVVDGVSDAAGGVGLWARTAAATCFRPVQVQVG